MKIAKADSFRFRLGGMIVILVIIPLGFLTSVTSFLSSGELISQSLELQTETARRVSRDFMHFVDHGIDELQTVDSVIGFANVDGITRRHALETLLLRTKTYQELAILDDSGREVERVSRTETFAAGDLRDRSSSQEFIVPFTREEVYFGEAYFDLTIREPLISIAIPIIEPQSGRVSHVIVARVRFREFWDLLARLRLPRSTDVFVTNESGTVVAHRNPSIVLTQTRAEFPDDNNLSHDFAGNEAIFAMFPVALGGQKFAVVSLQPTRDALASARNNLYLGVAVAAVTFILASIFVLVIARRVSLPIESLAATARSVTAGNLDARFETQIGGEIGDLSEAFNAMTARLRSVIDELKRSEYIERERAHITLESIGDAVISTDRSAQVLFLNPVAERLTGWSLEDAREQPLYVVFRIINEHTRMPALDPVERCLREGEIVGLANDTVLISRDGQEYAIEDSAAPIRDKGGAMSGVVLVFRDVTESRHLQRQIKHQASHDALTGLINRAEFESRLKRVLSTAKSGGSEHALCYLDLDQFKVVNDTSGHTAGDELLKQVSDLFKSRIRKRDTLARLGGDEFAVLMEHCGAAPARRVAEELRRCVEEMRFRWDDKAFSVGVSIGLVAIDSSSESVTGVLRAADGACYAAKDAGRNRIHVYQQTDEDLAKRHGEMQWVAKIGRAMAEQQFSLYAQPILSLDTAAANSDFVELLLRLVADDGGIVMPSTFLPAAERYNLAQRIDRWVVANAFDWIAEQSANENFSLTCAINLSGQSVGDESFLVYVNEQFELKGVAGERICFEITETAAITRLSTAIRFLESLKRRGCYFALDDFGSGLSSFAYLKNLPVDYLKIDGLFVRDMDNDPIDLAMVKSINEVAHIMGMKTVAEWVESNSLLAQLKELGVDFAQGRAVGAPVPLSEMAIR